MTIIFNSNETRSYRTNDLATIIAAIYGADAVLVRVRGSRWHVTRTFGTDGVGVVARLRVTF